MTGSILYIPMSHPTDADFSLNTDLVQGVFPGALKTFSFDQGYKLFGLQVNFFSITILKAEKPYLLTLVVTSTFSRDLKWLEPLHWEHGTFSYYGQKCLLMGSRSKHGSPLLTFYLDWSKSWYISTLFWEIIFLTWQNVKHHDITDFL